MPYARRVPHVTEKAYSFSASSGSVAREFDFHFSDGESIRVLCSSNRVLNEFSHNSSVKGGKIFVQRVRYLILN